METNKAVHMVTYILMAVGGLNWGLIGFFNFNLVSKLFGTMPMVEQVIYMAVGVAAVIEVAMHMESCKWCSMKGKKS